MRRRPRGAPAVLVGHRVPVRARPRGGGSGTASRNRDGTRVRGDEGRRPREFGATKGVVHASSSAWKPACDAEEIGSNVVESVNALDEFARERDFELCVENIPDGWFSVHDFDGLFAETDASMTLDTGHARMDGLDSGDIAAFVERHGDRISHFHLNDTRRAKDEHLPFGAGTLDFRAIFDALPDDWEGTLSLEVFTLDYGYIETSKAYLDELL
ncbi:sugar phosphate isomerase/epimerase [Haladaptatus sp. W1]|uniref:sugar phosphate isomerase/epimerase family protein n=1 Tax=Haladaptatus sp. W1 TaxID=1897478 RepID=UPI0020C7C99E|nr:sugar phosphate isomerase/epimerase [Haladaptatus sp. W1]